MKLGWRGRRFLVNFFRVNEVIMFADLPGYGYAKVSKTLREDWGKMAEQYLSERDVLILCVQLVDSRHEPTRLDKQLHEWLRFNGKSSIIVATKADKLSSNQLRKSISAIERELAGTSVLAYSSATGTGQDSLWEAINSAVLGFPK